MGIILTQKFTRQEKNTGMDVIVKTAFGSLLLFTLGVVCFCLYGFVYNVKLTLYLKKNKYDRWRELSSIGRFGPGMSNPLRAFRYVYGKLDDEDESILRYKHRIRLAIRLGFFTGVAMFVNAIILFQIGKDFFGSQG